MNANDCIIMIMVNEGITQGEIARRVGMSQSALSRCLIKGMSLDTLVKMADAVGYDLILRKRDDEVVVS